MRAWVSGQDSLSDRSPVRRQPRWGGEHPGGVRERPNRHAWKACVGKLTVGSNPTPSAERRPGISRSPLSIRAIAFVGPGTLPYTVDQSSEGDVLQSSEWDITFLAHGSTAVTVTYTYEGTSSTTSTVPGPTTTVPGTLPRTL